MGCGTRGAEVGDSCLLKVEKQSHKKKKEKKIKIPFSQPLRLSPFVTKQLVLDLSVSLLFFSSQVKSLKCLEG